MKEKLIIGVKNAITEESIHIEMWGIAEVESRL